uniref:Uncharacterized protein n=1 Tax=Chenopodium quinoa TaxID=63459 RepID=A0A803M587_CHEQI
MYRSYWRYSGRVSPAPYSGRVGGSGLTPWFAVPSPSLSSTIFLCYCFILSSFWKLSWFDHEYVIVWTVIVVMSHLIVIREVWLSLLCLQMNTLYDGRDVDIDTEKIEALAFPSLCRIFCIPCGISWVTYTRCLDAFRTINMDRGCWCPAVCICANQLLGYGIWIIGMEELIILAKCINKIRAE